MRLGKRIWTLWRLKPWTIASLLVATFMAVWSVAQISLLPPGLTPRELDMATATTQVIVDTPTSAALDLRLHTYDLDAMTQRAILIGNVIANGAVRQSIAKQVGVPVERLEVTAPFTRRQPRAVATTGQPKRASDLVKSTDQYRISIEANPTVPLLSIYAQAPSAKSAEILANAAVDGTKKYLDGLASEQQIPSTDQMRLLQLGRAHGAVINKGIDFQVAGLAFLVTFALMSATVIFISRVVRGFRLAAVTEQRAGA